MKDIIIAWLNGAEIEWRGNRSSGKWRTFPNYSEGCSVYFHPMNHYRIKPKEPDYILMWQEALTMQAGIDAVVSAAKQWQKENG